MHKLSIKKYKKAKFKTKLKAKAKAKLKEKEKAKAKSKIITKFFFSIFLIVIFILSNNPNILQNIKIYLYGMKRVGVVNISIDLNVGNILVKFSMFKKLEEMGFNATIIAPNYRPFKYDISFVNRTIGSHLCLVDKNFSRLKEKDFDYLMVSSDQTWHPYVVAHYYKNIAFLKFAEKWYIKKFIYGASAGGYELPFKEGEKILIKSLLTNFTGISFREKGFVKIFEDSIGLKSEFVLDPTFLLSKNYYLNTIKNYKSIYSENDKFIFIYQLDRNYVLEKTIKKASKLFNFIVNKHQFEKSDYMESFIYGMNNGQAIITDSFHGTVFSIIFNKPFIAFSNSHRGKARFDSIREVFGLDDRMIEPSSYENININLLIKPLNIDQSKLKKLKKFSLNYLKRNLDMVN